jgi:hypothetical protein
MNRRATLAVLAMSVLVAGCFGPTITDPNLYVHNEANESVTLRITTYDDLPERSAEPVFTTTVSVPPDSMRAVKVVERGTVSDGAEGQFDLVVERGSQSVRFTARPICRSATTNVTVEPSGNLSYYVTYCEGNPATGVATTGTA